MDEYDAMFMKLSNYAPHMVSNERESIQRLIEGLRDLLFAQVGTQMETFPSYTIVVDTTRQMETRMKLQENLNNKRKRGQDGRSLSRKGNSTPVRSIDHAPFTTSVPRPQSEGIGGQQKPLCPGCGRCHF